MIFFWDRKPMCASNAQWPKREWPQNSGNSGGNGCILHLRLHRECGGPTTMQTRIPIWWFTTCLHLFEGSDEHQKWACETIRIPLNIRGITNVKWKPLCQERRQLTRSAIYTKLKLWADGKHFGMYCEFSTTATSVIHKKVKSSHRSTKIMTEDASGFF